MGEPTTREVIESVRDVLRRVPSRYNLILTTESWQEINNAADALQGLLDGGLHVELMKATVRPNFEIEFDPDVDGGYDFGAEQMRERCAKYVDCHAAGAGTHTNVDIANGIRALPLRESKEDQQGG